MPPRSPKAQGSPIESSGLRGLSAEMALTPEPRICGPRHSGALTPRGFLRENGLWLAAPIVLFALVVLGLSLMGQESQGDATR